MRRWAVLIIAGAWIALALLVAGARWFGQQTAQRTFPLPESDGCWQTMCMFDPTGRDSGGTAQGNGVRRAVWSACRRGGMGETRFLFRYDAGRGEPLAVELVWDTLIYLFTPVDLTPDSPWPTVGDAVAELGAPERVMLLGDEISLHYAQHTLVTFSQHGAGPPHRLSPEDRIAGISVMRRDPAPRAGGCICCRRRVARFTFYEFD